MGCKPSSSSGHASGNVALGANPGNILHAATTAGLRDALQALDVAGKGQVLDIQCDYALSGVDAQYIADFLQRHASAIDTMALMFRCQLSSEAIETFRGFFTMTSLNQIVWIGKLGSEAGGHLLSGLHENRAVTKLVLSDSGFAGNLGGGHLSALLQNNSHLKSLICMRLPLRLEGALSLQSSLRTNDTLQSLSLHSCLLGDEGTLVLVNALEHNSSIEKLCLGGNGITSNGLPHITRLLRSKKSFTGINLSCNYGIFDNQENTKHFARALVTSKQLRSMNLSRCRIPVNALIDILQASANALMQLYVYDIVQYEGKDLERLLQTLPGMTKLHRLQINMDFTNESVSSFHDNTQLRHLHGEGNEMVEITNGPMFYILERNRWLYKTKRLRKHERLWNNREEILLGPRRSMFSEGLWIKVMEQIAGRNGQDNSSNTPGATAVYKILQDKLVVWAK
jgi:hypothetical protein